MDEISTTTPSPTITDTLLSSTGHATFAFTPPGANWTPKPTSAASTMGNEMGSMVMNGNCRVSMLWNWYTIDACFLSKSWQIKSKGGFAGLCIGVILLVMLLELLRRGAKTYDRHLIWRHQKTVNTEAHGGPNDASSGALIAKVHQPALPTAPFRPNVYQQLVRTLLHTLQFTLAYLIMLLAMYYNGYIIICIIIGAFLGGFIFQWEHLGNRNAEVSGHEAAECC
ncbi:putative high affinity copper protein [Biscogniauxia sp. FL1348]|nr:putative high affinity copper protein [Biscogniauxia sp. FL1348]